MVLVLYEPDAFVTDNQGKGFVVLYEPEA